MNEMTMKICIPVRAGSEDELYEKLKAAEKEADVTEIWLDRIPCLDMKKLMTVKTKPVLCVNKGKEEGGVFRGSEEERVRILMRAAKEGAEYIDVGINTKKELLQLIMKNKKRSKIIVSYHDFEKSLESDELKKLFERARTLKADVIKIAVTPKSRKEAKQLLEFLGDLGRMNQKAIVIGMGDHGRITRTQAKKYGAYMTYASLRRKDITAPGQLTVKQLKNILCHSK